MARFSLLQILSVLACLGVTLAYVRAAFREMRTTSNDRVALGAGIVMAIAISCGLAVCVGVLFGNWLFAVGVFLAWTSLYAYIWLRMFF